ncbi:MAG TPA: hypothetical protein VIR77_00410, partial [Pontiella sp.]
KCIQIAPASPSGWINLAAVQLMRNKVNEAFTSLRKAVELGGEPVRNMLRKDKRFDPVRKSREFQQIAPQIQPADGNLPLIGLPGM